MGIPGVNFRYALRWTIDMIMCLLQVRVYIMRWLAQIFGFTRPILSVVSSRQLPTPSLIDFQTGKKIRDVQCSTRELSAPIHVVSVRHRRAHKRHLWKRSFCPGSHLYEHRSTMSRSRDSSMKSKSLWILKMNELVEFPMALHRYMGMLIWCRQRQIFISCRLLRHRLIVGNLTPMILERPINLLVMF